MKRRWFGVLLLLLGATVTLGGEMTFQQHAAVMDSARQVPPKRRLEWLHDRGIELPGQAGMTPLDSGLSLAGKWGRGPAAEVTGRDTLVVLTLGSEVALLSFANPDSPRVLSEIQFPSLTAQSYLRDSLLYTSSNADLEIWNVANPTQPVRRGQIPAPVGDFWIRDTFLCFIRRDTFHVFSIANPANLYELGSAYERGSATTDSGSTVVVLQGSGFAFVDVSNPASPHEVSTYPCGNALSATARGTLVCASYEETSYPYPAHFITLDITNPASPRQLANLTNLGGFDIFLDSALALVSGRSWPDEPFQVLSIADSASPALIDSCFTTERYNWGVWANLDQGQAFVADEYDGLAIVDMSNIGSLVLDTLILSAGPTVDICVDGRYGYVAGDISGLQVLDLVDPTAPRSISAVDTAFTHAMCNTVVARDSFAFMGWRPPYLRTVCMTDPEHPEFAAACALFNPPEDIVLRDSFLYIAEDNRFQIVNVARPREPQVVGTCGLPERSREVILSDTLAYVDNLFSVTVLSIAQPTTPRIMGAWEGRPNGIDLHDTILYAVGPETLWSLSVSDPAAPRALGFVPVQRYMHDVVVVGTIAYCAGWEMAFVSVADPRNLRLLPDRWVPPSWIRRVISVPPHIYACCTDGGVSILETLQTGVSEGPSGLLEKEFRAAPTVTAGRVRLLGGHTEPWRGPVVVFDASGAKVTEAVANCNGEVDLTNAPGGVYLLRFETGKGSGIVKVVKTTRR
jgi:hypothetical protein